MGIKQLWERLWLVKPTNTRFVWNFVPSDFTNNPEAVVSYTRYLNVSALAEFSRIVSSAVVVTNAISMLLSLVKEIVLAISA